MLEGNDATKTEIIDWDVKHGVAHGYWNKLLNFLALAAHNELGCDGNPRNVLNIHNEVPHKLRGGSHSSAKAIRHEKLENHNQRVGQRVRNDPIYWALHITIVRLFTE